MLMIMCALFAHVQPHPCVSQLITAVEDDDEEMVFKLLHAKKVYANTCNKASVTCVEYMLLYMIMN